MSLAIQPQDRIVFTQIRSQAQSEQAKTEIADLLDRRDQVFHQSCDAALMVAKMRRDEQMMLTRRHLAESARLEAELDLIDAKLAALRAFVKG